MNSAIRLFRRYRLELVSFITGFSLLTYELAAARVLAPSIGSSTYVWTGVIGVIIAALSLGFFAGGKLADGRNRQGDIAWLLILASVMTVFTLISYQGVLQSIVMSVADSRMQAVVAALILFAPASFFIGTTGPYLAKLNVRALTSTGQSVASLDMFNAIGGIAGTFVTGFILFGFIGSREAIALVAMLLIIISWLFVPRRRSGKRAVISLAIILCALTPATQTAGAITIDTPSANYKVITGYLNDHLVTGLVTGPGGTQSAVYQDGLSDPVFWYTREMSRIALELRPKSILILGGGAFTLPQHLSETLPRSTIDVVEIDPELETISKQYFDYKNPSSVNEIFTDARTYVNSAHKAYDLVLVDVYGDTSIPFSLMTKEYGRSVSRLVKPDGTLVANIIGGLKGKCRDTFGAVDAAYRAYLPNVRYSNESGQVEARANHIVAYSRVPRGVSGLKPLAGFGTPAYSDNYAPAERLYYDCQSSNK